MVLGLLSRIMRTTNMFYQYHRRSRVFGAESDHGFAFADHKVDMWQPRMRVARTARHCTVFLGFPT